MPSERLLSPPLEPGSYRAPTAGKEKTTILGTKNNGSGSLKGSSAASDHETIDSTETAPDKASPFTHEFFRDLASATLRSFPFEQFAKDHVCEVSDVVQAIKATIVEPFSKTFGSSEQKSRVFGDEASSPLKD
ncbi:hypothetical protein BJX65DRAFT_313090 [Aspergillus insuetus]